MNEPRHQSTIQTPRPLCRLCMCDDPKIREVDGGCELICDECWQREHPRDEQGKPQ